jgi:transposase-like protein
MFVSCKDYDDDFAKRDADIAALRAELESRLAQCKANCDAEHAKFLTQHQSLEGYAKLSDIPSLEGYAKLSDIPSLEGYATLDDVQKANEALAALQAELAEYVKAEAIKDALAYIESLQDKGITADGLSELMTKVKAIDESLADYAKIDYVDQKVETAVENINKQIEALDLYEKALKEEGIEPDKVIELLKKIDDLKVEIKKYPADDLTDDEVADLRRLIAKVEELVNMEAGPDINLIQYLIDKTLASIILMPSDYVAGLATIEVPALYYQPVIYKKNDGYDEAYFYIGKDGKRLGDGPWNSTDLNYRFDDGSNAPSATIPTWDEGFGWSDDYSGYDYKGEGSNRDKTSEDYGKLINDGEGTMLPIFRTVVEKYKALKTAQLVPAAIAKYHVNPTTVKLDDYKLSFWTNTAVVTDQIESRNTGYLNSMANNFAAPIKENGADYTVSNGILEVPFKINNWENYVEDLVYYFDGVAVNQKKQSKFGIVRDSVNFIALQMTKGDTATITSDYAAVVPALIHLNAIADNGPENPVRDCYSEKYYNGMWATKKTEDAGHMFTYAKEAIDEEFTHTVAYNDTLDIMPFVETHFTYVGVQSAWASYDQRMDAETFNKLGLKYVFSVVDYEDGKHKTGESRHISIEPHANAGADFGYDKVNLIPRSVEYSADGKSFSQIKDKVATREAIDREPLIKVELIDPNNNVLLVGYIKLLITDNYKQYAFDLTIFDDYWMNCTAEGGLKWSQIEESILSVLGGSGYTKTQFEAEYEIDRITGSANAKRFKKNKDGKFVEDDAPVGLVYYTEPTPQDDPESKQTNVIKWKLTEEDYVAIAEQITGTDNATDARKALLDNKGDGTETMYTTIRFVKRVVDDQIKDKEQYKDMTALYVTLNLPGPQVHFAYGEITKKDLAHWYKLNSYKSGSETDYSAIDILENVPTPAENANVNLENDLSGGTRTDEFERPLYENFLNGMVSINMGGKEKNFSKYVYTKDGKNINVDFEFTLPVKGVNAEFDYSTDVNPFTQEKTYYWTVKGISGRTYKLTLGANEDGEPNKGIWDDCNPKTLIAQIVTKEEGKDKVPYIRLEDNDCANDILNYAGRYDANGANMANESESDPFYLNNPEGDAANRQTFTTYLQIKTKDNPCYELLVKNPYFNAKFLRPINVWGSYYEWNDAFNAVQTLYPSELLSAKDWRDYIITLDIDKNFKEKEIGWDYYNIYALSIDYDEIYTDHAAEKSVRDAIAAGFKSIPVSKLFSNNKSQLNKVSEIPSLKNPYLRILALNDKLETTQKINGKDVVVGIKAPQTPLEYTNNGGNVQDFHLFVPVYVQYAWGHNLKHYQEKDWSGKVTAEHPNTFKVWTVIKVHQTTGSGSAEAKKY